MTSNRYHGQCVDCATHVEAGEGVYTGGMLRCAPVVAPAVFDIDGATVIVNTEACPTYQRREAKQRAKAEAARAAYVAPAEEVAERAERAAKRAAQDAAWAAQGLVRCDRCGGAGGWKGWPGFTCFGCDGHGTVDVEVSA